MGDTEYIILQGLPTPQRYHDLRKLAKLTPPPLDALAEAVPKALQNSFACFVAYERKLMANDTTPSPGQDPVAMGRLIGDGGLFLQLCDMAVHPDHQRRGLGKRIVGTIVEYVDANAPHAYLSLVADPPGQRLYPQFGFTDVKPSLGMCRRGNRRANSGLRQAPADESAAAAAVGGPGASS